MKIENFIKSLSFAISGLILVAIGFVFFFVKTNVVFALIVTICFIIVLAIINVLLPTLVHDARSEIESDLDSSIAFALEKGEMGLLTYNDEFEITWMSSFFINKKLNHVDEKILNWLPDLQPLIEADSQRLVIAINDDRYQVSKIENSSTLVFKDISQLYQVSKQIEDDSYVLGLLNYDNVDENFISQDDIYNLNNNIKMPIYEYFKKFGILYVALKNNRLLLIMNERIYKAIYNDHFSILTKTRKTAKEYDLPVTLSIAIAKGGNDFNELFDNCQSMMELAQTRGGDQVIVSQLGANVLYFGGTSEAREKQSKTQVRVMYNSFKDLINKSENVFVVGHKEMDADCLGAAIALSTIVKSLNKPCYIITKSGGMEAMIADVLDKYNKVLSSKCAFLAESEAVELVKDNSLVIMVDHHMLSQSNGSNLLKIAKKIAIIDHHRRSSDLDSAPLLSYIEPAASSSCELVCEFLHYVPKRFELSDEEANIIYIGIMIDTDNFRLRTGTRTFEVLKQLRSYGADPDLCNSLSQEPFKNVKNKSLIIASGQRYHDSLIIASMQEGVYSRAIASQACDAMIKSKDIVAAFVICHVSKDTVAISARSKGEFNVQVILEKMGGGGHMYASGLQRSQCEVSQLEIELKNVLDEYFKGGQ